MRRLARLALSAAAALTLMAGVGTTPASAAAPSPGAPGAGDRLFPGLGNGGYDVLHYDLGFDYDARSKLVQASTRVVARATQSLSRFDLDFDGNTISRLTVNGAPAHYRRNGAELVVTPAHPIHRRSGFVVAVTYRADPRAKHHCPAVPPLTGSAWLPTKDGFGLAGQPNCAHTVFPSNDVTSDKATYTTTITTPDTLQSVANGALVGVRHHAGTVTRRFVSTDPIATELVQAAVGRFTVLRHAGPHGLPLRDVVPTDVAAKTKPLLAKESKHIAWMERQVGMRYPFQDYGVLGLHADFGFALETQTISLYTADTLTTNDPGIQTILVHELAHQWFGDYVAPATWSDVWLNEGHATWYEDGYGQKLGLGSVTQQMRSEYENGDEYRAQYGPVAKPKTARTMFSDQVYGGGALVLYALRQLVGDRTFRAIEHHWLTAHGGRSASTDDFIDLASRVSHRDLHPFLRAWLYGTKTPPMPGHPGWHVAQAG